MRKNHWILLSVLCIGLLAACTPAARTQDAMMEKTATTDTMMPDTGAPAADDDMMDMTGTPDTMEVMPTKDDMMDETGTPDTMEAMPTKDDMMDETGTPDTMEAMPTKDDMMDETGTPDTMEAMPTKDDMMDKTGTPEMMETSPTADAMMGTEAPQADMMAPAWFSTEMTNVTSGERFTIEDFKGKVVLVETFAQWCSTCLSQQKQVVKLHEMMGMPADLVTIGLDVDPNEDADMLKQYLEKHGFDWHYAIASTDTAREIGMLYGDQFLNPPSAPMLIIDRHGEVHVLPFGVKSAEDLQESLQPFLNDGM